MPIIYSDLIWRLVKRQMLSMRTSIADQATHFEVFTDGSLKAGKGSWAFVILKNGKLFHESSGRAKKTTSNRMEFQSAIEALRLLPQGSEVTLFSDSRVLIDTVTLWMQDWQSNGWVKRNRIPIPSVDQIKILYQLDKSHRISWRWVRAHSGNIHNERADHLCLLARD